MILSFKELKKRDVVNIADGRSFGKITDLKIDFPCATLKGIVVKDKKRSGLFGLWCKNEIFIDEKQIVRIGGDVILVNIKHCEAITPAVVDINAKKETSGGQNKQSTVKCMPCPKPQPPDLPPCSAPCPTPPPFPAPCPPPIMPYSGSEQNGFFEEEVGTDFEEY